MSAIGGAGADRRWSILPRGVATMRRTWSAVTERADYLRRAARGAGSERDEVLLGAKTVIAAMAAWVLARYLLPPSVSTFSPFTALVALQATVYRSVRDCLQYVLAMAAGAGLAATLAALAGIHGWTFGLLTLLALCVGRIRRFGQQGTQVAIVGFFAFSSGQGQIDYIGQLVASVGIGALCGLAAHLILAPARHTGHRQQAVTDLYTTMAQRLDDLADTLEASDPDPDHLRQWRRDWRRLSAECERIRHTIEAEIENGRMNPRPTISGSGAALPRAREAITVAERSMDHLRSMTRTLDYALDSGELGNLPATFRPGFSAVLRAVATVMEEMGRAAATDPDLLDAKIDETVENLDRVQRRERTIPEASPAVHALQGTLLTDAGRLLADLRSGWQGVAST
ncbi:aromatic acid exporter family protein [Streptomyces sp. NBC_01565]|uniref:FUSC family protein n=1 Tax=unclassified Streptomyces TaxID=2593676 RepID=UPI002251F424|nr:aromatic acid exporter family protein [Streptomyces sp. NBC_01565]MCX4546035.1 aromatic acid exporter family protein [Streptomyces sp. NBC_01565]